MSANKIKDAFSNIKASEEFKSSLIRNLKNNAIKSNEKRRIPMRKPVIAAAAVLFLAFGAAQLYPRTQEEPTKIVKVTPNYESVAIPKVELPADSSGAVGKMMPLIVYNGRIYTGSATSIDPLKAKDMLGDKLGTTKGNIDEWSSQTEYSKELASTIGIEDVYTVKGYDKSFRIMTYTKLEDGSVYPQLFECLNGLTVKSGEDILGKLNLKENATAAKYRGFTEWNNGLESTHPISNTEALNTFLGELNNTAPYLYEKIAVSLDSSNNDEGWRELTIELSDGSKTTLTLFKDGYIHYGTTDVYFKMESTAFQQFWSKMPL